ncbi:hypothetical protein P378_13375 [Desulforamulus profundi]|uniref:Uncharacterized protein n=1 Tax=Desulforamulus profundi TaxID=1383067 RepID=A0A2C6MCX6_9FIRM|nr:hypothetical protein [Desulforamulus profundi]MCL5780047.1 hypothetical protein [Bacillota bacterium]PHJ37908.1 hypothetical protein P378_13375 [Desulforamulus profundi]
MATNIIVSMVFLLILGLVMTKGIHDKDNIKETPLVYRNPTVQFILKLSILLFIGFSGFILFYNWKLFAGLLVGGILTAKFTTVWIWDKVFHALFAPQTEPLQQKKAAGKEKSKKKR